MPTPPRALRAAATAAALSLSLPLAAPALAATHHAVHHHKQPAKRMTLATAKATALKSASPLILDPADQVRVTGCKSVTGGKYSCGLELHAAQSASVCTWTVVVGMTPAGPDTIHYSRVDCVG
jgi:hypothetical protein